MKAKSTLRKDKTWRIIAMLLLMMAASPTAWGQAFKLSSIEGYDLRSYSSLSELNSAMDYYSHSTYIVEMQEDYTAVDSDMQDGWVNISDNGSVRWYLNGHTLEANLRTKEENKIYDGTINGNLESSYSRLYITGCSVNGNITGPNNSGIYLNNMKLVGDIIGSQSSYLELTLCEIDGHISASNGVSVSLINAKVDAGSYDNGIELSKATLTIKESNGSTITSSSNGIALLDDSKVFIEGGITINSPTPIEGQTETNIIINENISKNGDSGFSYSMPTKKLTLEDLPKTYYANVGADDESYKIQILTAILDDGTNYDFEYLRYSAVDDNGNAVTVSEAERSDIKYIYLDASQKYIDITITVSDTRWDGIANDMGLGKVELTDANGNPLKNGDQITLKAINNAGQNYISLTQGPRIFTIPVDNNLNAQTIYAQEVEFQGSWPNVYMEVPNSNPKEYVSISETKKIDKEYAEGEYKIKYEDETSFTVIIDNTNPSLEDNNEIIITSEPTFYVKPQYYLDESGNRKDFDESIFATEGTYDLEFENSSLITIQIDKNAPKKIIDIWGYAFARNYEVYFTFKEGGPEMSYSEWVQNKNEEYCITIGQTVYPKLNLGGKIRIEILPGADNYGVDTLKYDIASSSTDLKNTYKEDQGIIMDAFGLKTLRLAAIDKAGNFSDQVQYDHAIQFYVVPDIENIKVTYQFGKEVNNSSSQTITADIKETTDGDPKKTTFNSRKSNYKAKIIKIYGNRVDGNIGTDYKNKEFPQDSDYELEITYTTKNDYIALTFTENVDWKGIIYPETNYTLVDGKAADPKYQNVKPKFYFTEDKTEEVKKVVNYTLTGDEKIKEEIISDNSIIVYEDLLKVKDPHIIDKEYKAVLECAEDEEYFTLPETELSIYFAAPSVSIDGGDGISIWDYEKDEKWAQNSINISGRQIITISGTSTRFEDEGNTEQTINVNTSSDPTERTITSNARIDRTAPSITKCTFPTPVIYPETTNIEFEATDELSGVYGIYCSIQESPERAPYIYGEPLNTTNGKATYQFTPTSIGTYYIFAYAKDNADNAEKPKAGEYIASFDVKYEPQVTGVTASFVYNSENKAENISIEGTATYNGQTVSGSFEYTPDAEVETLTKLPSLEGNYSIKFKPTDNNYAEVEIAHKDIGWTMNPLELAYTGVTKFLVLKDGNDYVIEPKYNVNNTNPELAIVSGPASIVDNNIVINASAATGTYDVIIKSANKDHYVFTNDITTDDESKTTTNPGTFTIKVAISEPMVEYRKGNDESYTKVSLSEFNSMENPWVYEAAIVAPGKPEGWDFNYVGIYLGLENQLNSIANNSINYTSEVNTTLPIYYTGCGGNALSWNVKIDRTEPSAGTITVDNAYSVTLTEGSDELSGSGIASNEYTWAEGNLNNVPQGSVWNPYPTDKNVPSTNFENGKTYTVFVRSIDNAGNVSSTNSKSFTVPYSIKYYSGTAEIESLASYYYNESVTLPPTTTDAPKGYEFAGWTDAQDNIVKKIAATETGDKSFYEKWEAIEYTINYVLYNGTNAETNPTTYTVEDEVTLLAPTRSGYSFIKWTEGDKIVKGSTGDKTFTAEWSDPIEYTITLSPNGGSLADGENTIKYTVLNANTIKLPTPTRSGYNFLGWYDNNAQKVETITFGNMALAAVWEVKEITITYLVDGVKYTESKAKYGASVPSIATPTEQGYLFSGWSNNLPETMPAGNITVTGMFMKEITEIELTCAQTLNNATLPEYCNFAKDAQTPDPGQEGNISVIYNPDTQTYKNVESTVLVKVKGHDPVDSEAIPATCEAKGKTAGSYCSVCNKVLEEQEDINALGHSWGEWTTTKKATYTEEGEETRYCKNDESHSETKSVDKLEKETVSISFPSLEGFDIDKDVVYHFAGSEIADIPNIMPQLSDPDIDLTNVSRQVVVDDGPVNLATLPAYTRETLSDGSAREYLKYNGQLGKWQIKYTLPEGESYKGVSQTINYELLDVIVKYKTLEVTTGELLLSKTDFDNLDCWINIKGYAATNGTEEKKGFEIKGEESEDKLLITADGVTVGSIPTNIIDNDDPSIEIEAKPNNDDETVYTVTFTGSDKTSGVNAIEYSLNNGKIITVSTEKSTASITIDTPGKYSIKAQAIDQAANYSEPANLDFIVKGKPEISNVMISGTYGDKLGDFKVSGTANVDGKFEIVYADNLQTSDIVTGKIEGVTVKFTPSNTDYYATVTAEATKDSWNIQKRKLSISASESNISLTRGRSKTIEATLDSDQILDGTSAPKITATCADNGLQIDGLDITATKEGSFSITISIEENNNYDADPVTISAAATALEVNFQQESSPYYCYGQTAEIQLAFTDGQMPARYKAGNGEYKNLEGSGSTGTISIPVEEGTFHEGANTVSIVFAEEEGVETNPQEISVNVNVSSDKMKLLYNDIIFIDNSEGSYTSYQWYKNGVKLEGDTLQYLQEWPRITKGYTADVTDLNGNTMHVCPAEIEGISLQKTASMGASVYPNPAQAGQEITIEIHNAAPGSCQVYIYNNMGTLIRTLDASQGTAHTWLPSGSYSGQAVSNGGKASFKIIVE